MPESVPPGVANRLAIEDLVATYCDAVSRGDQALWRSCWADDATWVLDTLGEKTGADAIVEWYTPMREQFELCVQEVLSGRVVLDGDHARGRWYVRETQRRGDGTGGLLMGCYDDEYVRTADGWRFARREFRFMYRERPAMPGIVGPPPPAFR